MVRVKYDQRGFTLSELLVAVAILLVLAALALPSILSASRGAHMTELDAGAAAIAEAAQNQMTAMKVAGTWLDLFQEEYPEDSHARHLPPNIANPSDYYYFTADEARENGVLPAGAIESAVRDNDFIIEYNRSTATVVGVFYSDGKAGIFGTALGGTPAEDYYLTMTSSAGRDHGVRLAADTLVGYYEGTPTGATNTVALENPAIWIDKTTGTLNVQNPNLTDHASWNTALEVMIYHTDATTEADKSTFVLGSLQGSATMYSLSMPDGPVDNRDNHEPQVFKLISRTTSASADISADVFQIDMSALLQALGASEYPELAALATAYAANDPITVEAKVTTNQKPCIPSKAKAHVVWTDPTVQLRVLVTDPKGTIEPKPGTVDPYTAPTVEIKPNETDLQLLADSKTITLADITGLNEAARQQVFTGGRTSLEEVASAQAVLHATAGKFTDRVSSPYYPQTYQYQVYEVWVNDVLAGAYDDTGAWTWRNGLNARGAMVLCNSAGNAVSADEASVMTDIGTSVKIDTAALAAGGIPANASHELTIIVKTAPTINDVQSQIFGRLRTSSVEENHVASARQTDEHSLKIQSTFENTFGCSSSVALWSVKCDNEVGYEKSTFNDKNYYTYYAPTPYNPDINTNLTTSVATRYYDQGGGYYRHDNVGFALGQNLEADPRIEAAAGASGLRKPGIVHSTNKPNSGTDADFALPTDAGYLYYRIITYYQDDTQPLTDLLSTFDPLLVPYRGIDRTGNVQNNATIYPLESVPYYEQGKLIRYENVAQWKDQTNMRYAIGARISDCTNTLPFGLVKLNPTYVRNGAGVMYLEFDAGGNVSGYYGYVNGTDTVKQSLRSDNTIATWGYYVITSSENKTKPTVSSTVAPRLSLAIKTEVTIEGVDYYAYLIDNAMKKENMDIVVDSRATETSFLVNVNFAAAVAPAREVGTHSLWGTEVLPWKVRHAAQFPATLDPYGDKLQNIYAPAGHSFSQTHDIDMKDLLNDPHSGRPNPYSSNLKSLEVFKGTYKGRGYAIKNFSEQLGTERLRNTGLFNRIENAQLTGIRLVDSTSAKIEAESGVQNAFGCLTGTATNSIIQDCSIDGAEETGTPLSVSYTVSPAVSQSGAISAAGGLVGVAFDTAILSCSVKNISITYGTKTGVWDKTAVFGMGGLVGYYEVTREANVLNANITNIIHRSSYNQNIVLESTSIPIDEQYQKGCVAFGGVVGYYLVSGDGRGEIYAQTSPLPKDITYKIPGGTLGTTLKAGLNLGTSNQRIYINPAGGQNIYLWINGVSHKIEDGSGDTP